MNKFNNPGGYGSTTNNVTIISGITGLAAALSEKISQIDTGDQAIASNLDAGNKKITTTYVPLNDEDLTNRKFVDLELDLKFNKTGGVLNGGLDAGTNTISSSFVPLLNDHMVNKLYANQQNALKLSLTGGDLSGDLGVNTIDSTSATVLRIGGATATTIVLGDYASNIDTSIYSDLHLLKTIDMVSVGNGNPGTDIMKIGPSGASKLELGRSGITTEVKGDLEVIGALTTDQPRCKLIKSNWQTISTGNTNTITYSAMDFANDMSYSTGSGTITVPTAGVYAMGYECGVNVGSGTLNGYVKIWIDGVSGRFLALSMMEDPPKPYHSFSGSTIQYLAAGEVLSVQLTNTTGCVVGSPHYNTTTPSYQGDFWVYKLG